MAEIHSKELNRLRSLLDHMHQHLDLYLYEDVLDIAEQHRSLLMAEEIDQRILVELVAKYADKKHFARRKTCMDRR